MSLDQNLFTLSITPNKDDPTVLDLVDPSGHAHYRKQRVAGSVYKIDVYDPLSESLLASATAPSATSKHKTLELYNPTIVVELNYTGKLSFKWGFKWEEHEFEWKREECFMLRKPDPPVLVAVTREPAGRIKTTSVQILDYNLNRFDIEDRKGLEIVILTALLSFSDANEVFHTPQDTPPVSSPPVPVSEKAPPIRPPKPAPKTGTDRIAEMQAIRGEINEVTVEDEGSVNDYAQYCSSLLQDDAMLFVTIRSSAASHVSKVLQVVEQTKRIRHKAGISDDDGLHQYVVYDAPTSEPAQKGPRRIKLDDNPAEEKKKSKGNSDYSPPSSLTVHLSKIPMPELQPKAVPTTNAKDKKRDKPAEKHKKERKASESSPPQSSKISKPSSSSHIHSYQTHPYQPSPSPSQLNNPGIYAAAPPPRPPHSPYSHPRPSMHNGYAAPPPGNSQRPPNPPYLSPPPPGGQLYPSPQQKPTTSSTMVTGLLDRIQKWQV